MHQSTYENRAINSTRILTWKWSPFVICQEREAEAKQCGVKKNSLVIMCRLLHDPPLPPLGFSQTCYVSAGLMQACLELKVESAFFFSLSASAFFYFPSVEVILDKLMSAYFGTFDGENLFGSHNREVMTERRTGLKPGWGDGWGWGGGLKTHHFLGINSWPPSARTDRSRRTPTHIHTPMPILHSCAVACMSNSFTTDCDRDGTWLKECEFYLLTVKSPQ